MFKSWDIYDWINIIICITYLALILLNIWVGLSLCLDLLYLNLNLEVVEMNINDILNHSGSEGSRSPGNSGNPGPNPGGPSSETIAAGAHGSRQDDNHNEYPDPRSVRIPLTKDQVADGLLRKRAELLAERARIGNPSKHVTLKDIYVKPRKGGQFNKFPHEYQPVFDQLDVKVKHNTTVTDGFIQKIRDL
jgi:hypothetical protein